MSRRNIKLALTRCPRSGPALQAGFLEGQMWIYSRFIWLLTAPTTSSGGLGHMWPHSSNNVVSESHIKEWNRPVKGRTSWWRVSNYKTDHLKYSVPCKVFFFLSPVNLVSETYLPHSFADLIIQEIDTKCEKLLHYVRDSISVRSFPGGLQEGPTSILNHNPHLTMIQHVGFHSKAGGPGSVRSLVRIPSERRTWLQIVDCRSNINLTYTPADCQKLENSI